MPNVNTGVRYHCGETLVERLKRESKVATKAYWPAKIVRTLFRLWKSPCNLLSALENPMRSAKNGINIAPIGRKDRYPIVVPLKLNGMWCAPSQSQRAARMGSEVFPVALPAVAQAIRDIKASGRRITKTLRKTCANETARTRCNI
jgi:hypothetical protein